MVVVNVSEYWKDRRRQLYREYCKANQIMLQKDLPLNVRLSLYEKARNLAMQGLGVSAIAKILKVTHGAVSSWLKGSKPDGLYAPRIKVDRTKVKEISYLAGVVDSDGWIGHHNNYVTLQTTDEDFALEFSRAIKAVTGRYPQVTFKRKRARVLNGYRFEDKVSPIVVRIYSMELHSILSNPDVYINQCPQDYIRGFADGDGSITKGRSKYYRIYLYNADLNKLERIRSLLERLGIDSHLNHHRTNNKRQIYAIVITKQGAVKAFMEKIGFSINRKRAIYEPIEAKL